MVAPLIFLHPKLAAGTLLELLALHELHEGIVVCTVSITDFKLLAAHVFVPVDPTVQTVLLFAFETLESYIVILLEEEHVFTVRSWAPRY